MVTSVNHVKESLIILTDGVKNDIEYYQNQTASVDSKQRLIERLFLLNK